MCISIIYLYINLEAIATIQSHRIRKQQAANPRFPGVTVLTAILFHTFYQGTDRGPLREDAAPS